MSDKDTILVTGASGFIGGWLVETLHLSGHGNLRAGIRSWSSAARLGRFRLNFVPCDVMQKDQIAQAMTGVSTVIHCAVGARDVTVQGTENMLDVASSLGVKRFVHLSTTEVYGNTSGKVDESYPFEYTDNEYGLAKIEAEKLCWKYYAQGLPLAVIRPPIVYGPFSTYWVVNLAYKLQSGNWGVFEGYGDGCCNLIYVSDLVSGIILAAQHEQAIGQAFNLNGPEVITWNQYFERFNSALGLPELKTINSGGSKMRAAVMKPTRSLAQFALAHLETPIRKAYDRIREVRGFMRFMETTIKTTPQQSELELYNRQVHYLSTKAENILGYKPKYDTDYGIEMSAHWARHLGLID